MSDMLHIARSGILASRTALTVTAENVANAQTDGYRRREVASVTAAGGQTTPQTRPTGGQGVSVTEVRRAFDHLVAERGQAATSAQSAAQAQHRIADTLETRFIPGETGLDGRMRALFDSLSRLAASPDDHTTRAVTLQNAQALATDFAEAAGGLSQLRRDTVAQAQRSAGQAQGLLEDLHVLNGQFAQMGAGQTVGHHPLADQRDKLLTELAQHMRIAVDLHPDGRADLRLGSDAGPVLLDRHGPARLSVTAPDQLTLHISSRTGATHETRMLDGGHLGGLSLGIGAIDMARAEFDQLARSLANGMNALHRTGIDLTGAEGLDLFDMDGWTFSPSASVAGRVQAKLRLDGAQTLPGPLQITYDGPGQIWQARDAGGAVLATGQSQLVLPGVTLDLAGTLRDGDTITLERVTGRAEDMRLAIRDPKALAAAAAAFVAPASENLGVATLQLAAAPAPMPSDPLDLVVTDAASGAIELRDPETGTVLDAATPDPEGRVLLNGIPFVLSGTAQTGDRFTLHPTEALSGNGAIAQAISALRHDPAGGLQQQLSSFQANLGIRAAAAERAHETAQARLESTEREADAFGGVNLDVEAARMVELQQAYQASAQAMSIARSLFETLLRMI